MIFTYLKNLFTKTKKSDIQYSKFFPNKFYTNKLVIIDNSLSIFIKNSIITINNFLSEALFVDKIINWDFCGDKFEEIFITGNKYKLLYDKSNNIFYGLELLITYENKSESIINDSIVVIDGNEYEDFSGIIDNKDKNELLRIYSRTLTHEADEYVFVEVDKCLTERIWVGIIIQPTMIN